jgi:hypothetical protein
MTNDEVHSTIFKQRWTKLTIRTSAEDSASATHPEYLLMPPEKNWVLHVKPHGKGLQFIPTAQIASIELETAPVAP